MFLLEKVYLLQLMRHLPRIKFPGKTYCVSLNVNNTNTMIGKNNSIASRFLKTDENIFIAGCLCHLPHKAASNSHDAFSEYIGINVEYVTVDLFHRFDKSTKRKGKLKEYFEFCDQEYQGVFVCRLLLLERCISRAI